MALLSQLRYILSRFSFLKQPIPLASSLLVVIVSVFIWENFTHPEWFGTYTQEEAGPSGGDADLSGLTPQEQAAIADIDNLEVLLGDLGLAGQGTPSLQMAPESEQEIADDLLQQNLLDLSVPGEQDLVAESANPFAQYLNQYAFGAGSLQPPLQEGPSTSSVTTSGVTGDSTSPLNANTFTIDTPAVSQLQQALENQGLVGLRDGRSILFEATSGEEAPIENANGLPQELGESAASEPTEQGGSQAVNIPGVPFPVLSPTVQTSPPPGTTGYTPPASLSPSTPTPGSNLTPGFPATGVPPLPGTAGVPGLPPAGGSLDFRAPQVDVGNNSVAPSVPQPSVAPRQPEIAPSPFSVPRPPGSVIGGGYINTFSNPSAPPENR